MCLILLGWQVHPDFPLVVAANRDEYYARPTLSAARWTDFPEVIGGRDLEAGGTWLGVTENGRFAAVTNVREPGMAAGHSSRGDLTREFLTGQLSAGEFARQIDGDKYSGFNLLLSDGASLYYRTNRHGGVEELQAGVYGLSNYRLDTPWPKLLTARERFSAALAHLPDESDFFRLLADADTVDDKNLPKTGVSLEWERLLSAIFVQSESYGTRASTVLLIDKAGKIDLHERSFGPQGLPLQSSVISTGV